MILNPEKVDNNYLKESHPKLLKLRQSCDEQLSHNIYQINKNNPLGLETHLVISAASSTYPNWRVVRHGVLRQFTIVAYSNRLVTGHCYTYIPAIRKAKMETATVVRAVKLERISLHMVDPFNN